MISSFLFKMHSIIIINSMLIEICMMIKNKFGVSFVAIFAITTAIGLLGQIPSAVAEGWKVSNGFYVDNFFGIGQVQNESITNNEFKAFAVQMMEGSSSNENSALINSGTSVNLELSEFNGFKADNFFGIGDVSKDNTGEAIKSGTSVNLELSEFNGFKADNFFGQD